ncbi:hypothetical protein PENTCL1PPCAC_21109, partial [Pristionchus entomophagus]
LIGRKFDDYVVQSNTKHWPFEVIPNDSGKPAVQIEFKGEKQSFTPEEISALIIMKLKLQQSAESFLGGPVTDAVISVPAYFNEAQRQAIKDAGTITGLNSIRVVNE